MRTREEIEADVYDRSQRVLLEVLLDIRELLSVPPVKVEWQPLPWEMEVVQHHRQSQCLHQAPTTSGQCPMCGMHLQPIR